VSRSATSFITRLCVFVVSMALVGAELVVSAQNANSSTTMQEDTSMQNTNMTNTNMNRRGRRRRRGVRRSNINSNMSMTNANSACGPMQENANMDAAMQENTNTGAATSNRSMYGRRRRRSGRRGRTIVAGDAPVSGQLAPGDEFVTDRPLQMPAQTGRCDPNMQEQTDLSGTYTGRVGYTDVVMAGDATLTINGNDFTLANGQITETGRVVAVTTCNYTAVTMRFGKDATVEPGQTPPPPLPTVSLRAHRTGSGLALDTVPGESRMFSFHSTGASGGGKSRFRGGMKRGGPPPVGIKPPTE
jgi:hypothetical protein